MARKSKHHYIPKCYLKGFTLGGEASSKFWCIPTDNSSPFPTNPHDSCAKRDYYTVQHQNPLAVEDWYAEEVEPKIGKAIKHIKECASLPPKEEMRYLILLLATLYLRVPSFRSLLEAPLKRTQEIVESISQDVPISNRHEFAFGQTDLVRQELRLIDTVQASLANKYFQLHISADPDAHFLTSDRPFVLSHPEGERKLFGLNTPNIEICVPITMNASILARNERSPEGVFQASRQLVGLTNTKLALSASRYFYSSRENFLLVDDNIAVYTHTISTNKVTNNAPSAQDAAKPRRL